MTEGRSWDFPALFIIATDSVLWAVGISLFMGSAGQTARDLGELFTIIAATLTVVGFLRAWQLRMHRAFVHGYHAGWHDGTHRAAAEDLKGCPVLDLAEVKARRLSQLS